MKSSKSSNRFFIFTYFRFTGSICTTPNNSKRFLHLSESRVGLTNAAPYASMAHKALSRHFQNLKNAINGQLKFASKVLGEMSSLRLEGHRCGKSDGLSIDPLQLQHVWWPERGLPERAVAVLRNWLFKHFLLPYPSDMDKQVLAKQTGITRSRVSNWFINARVRLWKPLVEEIHSLEMKDSSSFIVLNSMKKPEHNIDSSNHESAFQHPKRSRWASDDNGDAGWVNHSYQSSQTLDKGRHAMGAVGGVSLTLGLPSQRPLFANLTMNEFCINDNLLRIITTGYSEHTLKSDARGAILLYAIHFTSLNAMRAI